MCNKSAFQILGCEPCLLNALPQTVRGGNDFDIIWNPGDSFIQTTTDVWEQDSNLLVNQLEMIIIH